MNAELQSFFDQAKAAKACEPGLAEVEKFSSLDQILASEHGPKFAAWFAMRVRNARMPEFETVIRRDVNVWTMYAVKFRIM